MEVHVLTLFPGYFAGPLDTGLLGRAVDEGAAQVRVRDLREWTHDRHRTADDYAFGGGPGMVLKPEPFFEALESLRDEGLPADAPVLLTSPQGRIFDSEAARELSAAGTFVILCGRYRGVDERVREALVSHEYSIGDVILNGGEVAALAIIEAVARLEPGAMSDPGSAASDSFATGLLDHPHYTRPASYRGMSVPEVLLSGDHAAIAQWRREGALRATHERRPDLLRTAELTGEERRFLTGLETESMAVEGEPAGGPDSDHREEET